MLKKKLEALAAEKANQEVQRCLCRPESAAAA